MQRRQRFVDWKDHTQVITHKLEERVGMRVRRDRKLTGSPSNLEK